jgi:hypothetical protein
MPLYEIVLRGPSGGSSEGEPVPIRRRPEVVEGEQVVCARTGRAVGVAGRRGGDLFKRGAASRGRLPF